MRLLITAGPTREPIDAVRFVSNRSSGRLGVALAEAGVAAGLPTTLLLARAAEVTTRPDRGYELHRFDTCDDLQRLLADHWPNHDVLIMAAAVADYRPSRAQQTKLERTPDRPLTLTLEPTPDLVAEAARTKRPDQRVVAFALEEPEQLEQRAHAKLLRKGVDAVVANPLDTMESDSIQPLWLTRTQREAPGRMPKAQFAAWLVSRLTRPAPR